VQKSIQDLRQPLPWDVLPTTTTGTPPCPAVISKPQHSQLNSPVSN